MRIIITTDPDGFYGPEGDTENGLAAYDEFCRLADQQILEAYPDAEIERHFEPTMTPIRVMGDAMDGSDIDPCREVVEQIEAEIWNDGDFWPE